MTDIEIASKIAELVKVKGGRTFFVGGYVRDVFLGINSKDIDLEVHGIDENTLVSILKEVGNPLEYGKSFGVYSLEKTNIDIALPRIETKIGEGHCDFDIKVDPKLSYEEAARRRDFTINSMMLDVINFELIDPFNGKEDLEKRIIKHIDDKTFVEDPLRVFRAAQFASRFGFDIDPSTINLCKLMDVTTLTKERIEEELKKALLKSDKPSLFFDYLNKMNKLDYWFYELKLTDGYKQNPKKHPEGDVYKHTMMALDEGVLYRNEVSNPYNFMLLLLVHDFGKLRTKIMTDDGIHFFGHENNVEDARNFLERVVLSSETKKYVLEMIPAHMLGHQIYKKNLDLYTSNKWFEMSNYPKDLVYLAVCDKSNHPEPNRLSFLMDRYNKYISIKNSFTINGSDLIKLGIEPNDKFSEYLEYAEDLKLKGYSKEDCLNRTIKYIENSK